MASSPRNDPLPMNLNVNGPPLPSPLLQEEEREGTPAARFGFKGSMSENLVSGNSHPSPLPLERGEGAVNRVF
jgi:hypothetical protein